MIDGKKSKVSHLEIVSQLKELAANAGKVFDFVMKEIENGGKKATLLEYGLILSSHYGLTNELECFLSSISFTEENLIEGLSRSAQKGERWRKCSDLILARIEKGLNDGSFKKRTLTKEKLMKASRKAASTGQTWILKRIAAITGEGFESESSKIFIEDTVFHEALRNGEMETMDYLINEMGFSEKVDIDCWADIMKLAAHKGDPEVLEKLSNTARSKSEGYKEYLKGNINDHPLFSACKSGTLEKIEFLLSREGGCDRGLIEHIMKKLKYDFDIAPDSKKEITRMLWRHMRDSDEDKTWWLTALNHYGDVETIPSLVADGMDPNMYGEDGYTAFHLVMLHSLDEKGDTVRRMIDLGSNVNLRVKDENGVDGMLPDEFAGGNKAGKSLIKAYREALELEKEAETEKSKRRKVRI